MEGKPSDARKTNKTRRETAVQGTNDSSIVSKCSTSSSGYFSDPFLHYFVSKVSRRAPLIHRGYYIRAVAFDRLLRNFLGLHQHSKKQIISLGCGFDSSYFRLKGAQCLGDTVYCEIDFPELVKKKRLLIENTDDLIRLVDKIKEPPLSPHIELSCSDYHLLGVDLTQLNTLEAALKMCGIDFETPTLLLSECVMTYMTRRCSTELVKWAAETFEEAVFGMYEQMSPDDAFGLFMQNHFHSIGSPLKCITSFPSLESQRKRFLSTGWAWCEALDMNTFYYHHIPTQERKRVEHLETFDEYEELNLKYSHYFILTASTVSLTQSLITNGAYSPEIIQNPSISPIFTITRILDVAQSVRRFGHASSLVNGQFAVSTGGFGEIDGRHQRLTEITVTDMTTFKSSHILSCSSDLQYSRMHHASVSLSDGTTFLIGGRQSPYFMCNQMLKICLKICLKHEQLSEISGEMHLEELNSHHLSTHSNKQQNKPVSDQRISKHVENRETSSLTENVRNSTTISTSSEIELQQTELSDKRFSSRESDIPGYDQTTCAELNDSCHSDVYSLTDEHDSVLSCTFDMGHVHISVVCQKGNIPKERWRHAATDVIINGQEKIFVHGGKTKSGDILGDSFLFDPVENSWEQLSCSGETPGPYHSHCVSHWNGQVVLTGGLDAVSMPSGDVFLLNLTTKVWEKLSVTGNLHSRYSHTAHLVNDNTLLLIGGVNLHHPPPGVAVINLRTRKALEFALPDQDKSNLLMFHRHSSVKLEQEKIVVLGGGGNCFSFGTHLNRTPVILNIGPCIDAVE
uniref:tRNA wybutosine-synthesizing protein 4 n=1 Tax=Arion vulgaris TaxID=1028688 RepID=A0A0B6Z319_9EUPU